MIVVFIVVLVVFGPQKLPELARGLGKLMAEFRKASLDFKTAFEEEMRDLERQALLAERKKAAEAAAASAAGEPPQALTATSSVEGTEAASPEASPVAPVIAPVAESVPRNKENTAETKPDGASPANLEGSPKGAQHSA